MAIEPDLLNALPIVGAWLARLEALYAHGAPVEEDDALLPASLVSDLKQDECHFDYFFDSAGDVGRFLVDYAARFRADGRPLLKVIDGGKAHEGDGGLGTSIGTGS